MIIVHAAPIAWDQPTGPNTVIAGLVAAQQAHSGTQTAVLLTLPEAAAPRGLPYPVFARQTCADLRGPLALPRPFDRPDLVVFHNTYYPAHAGIARRLRRAGIPYLICPHGGMTCLAQNVKRWKKRLGNWLFFNRLVGHSAALHFLTAREAEASSAWRHPFFVVGNGVTPPDDAQRARPGRGNRLRLLFLGRLDVRHKGLDLLLEACRLARKEILQAGARVELHGPDQQNSSRFLRRQMDRLELREIASIHGPVAGPAKTDLLQGTDVFLHTSRYEGHPMAVLEALSFGIPCLLTPNTNVAEEVAAAGAGWEVALSPEAIAQGILTVLRCPPAALEEAGARARELVLRQYTWEKIASQTLDAYRRFAA